jgi:hypothetical protein
VLHAVGYTFVDRTDGGRRTLAVSNFAGVAAGGFVANSYLPDGYNDVTHAGQRTLFLFAGQAGRNLLAEFRPELVHFARKLGISKSGKLPIPVWWTSN